MSTLTQKINARRKAVQKYASKFKSTFGVQLGVYLHPLYGFDVVGFDASVIQPPDGVSTKDIVQERYGDEAVELVVELIRL